MKNLLFLFLLFPLTLMAQVERESPGPVDVSGRVVNVSGEALPGASLWLVNQADTLKEFGVSTRDDGTYALAVPAARYHLRVSYVGFRPYAAEVDADWQDRDLQRRRLCGQHRSQQAVAATSARPHAGLSAGDVC